MLQIKRAMSKAVIMKWKHKHRTKAADINLKKVTSERLSLDVVMKYRLFPVKGYARLL